MDVKTLCLGVLCLDDATGYDIKQLFEEAFTHFHGGGYGSIYPALEKLTAEGMVTCRVEKQDRRPDRKLFSVTPAGRRFFGEQLAQERPVEKLRSEFLVQMFFSHLLSSDDLADKLDSFAEELQAKLDYLKSIPGSRELTPGMQFTVEYGIESLAAKLRFIRRRRDSLLADRPPASKGVAS